MYFTFRGCNDVIIIYFFICSKYRHIIQYDFQLYGEYDNWRRVRDSEGAGGWIHYSLLSGVRSIIITSSMANLYRKSDQDSMIMARIEQNYIADLGKCIKDWCEIDAGKYDGWIKKTDIWGVAPDEIR